MTDNCAHRQDDQRLDQFHLAEYSALADYFGRVITFRFSTAAFFIAAVAIILGRDAPDLSHFLLLLAISMGVWIVELRTRSLYMNLIERAQRIEERWVEVADFQNDRRNMPFFRHIHPFGLGDEPDKNVPEDAIRPDESRILNFRFRARWASHTIGLDIVYLSVVTYALYGIATRSTISPPPMSSMASVAGAILGLLLAVVGADLIKTGARYKESPQRRPPVIAGALVLVGAAVVLGLILWRVW